MATFIQIYISEWNVLVKMQPTYKICQVLHENLFNQRKKHLYYCMLLSELLYSRMLLQPTLSEGLHIEVNNS